MKRNSSRLVELSAVEKKVGYAFKSKELLQQAFVHSSFTNENRTGLQESNERLEFLGDSVLNLIVSESLFQNYPDLPEGRLSKLRSKIVCESTFAYAAKILNLGDYLMLGRGEEMSGARLRNSILADTFEAFCGAMYLDSSYATTYQILSDQFSSIIQKKLNQDSLFVDYKTSLQEICHKKSNARIHYQVVSEKGPDHDKEFIIGAYLNGQELGRGMGKNKKQGAQMAARDALLRLGEINE